MAVPMFPVNSSNLDYIGWQDCTLYITFKKGYKYKYEEVPEEVFKELKESTSIGSYYHANIKGKYTSSKI